MVVLRTGQALAVAGLLALGLATSAGAAAKARVKIAHRPVTLELPAGWYATKAARGAAFDASASSGYARLEVTTGTFPKSLAFAYFVKTEKAAARKAYRAQDPHATVSVRKIKLPSGPAVEINVTVRPTPGSAQLGIRIFSVVHRGVAYHFTYFTNASQLKSYLPAFVASARSIRFTTK